MTVSPARTDETRVCALLASHNRREVTLRSLQALACSAEHAGVLLTGVLVDDASRDGTAAAAAARFPWLRVLQGDGQLYWCRAMARAWQAAEALHPRPDFVLWLNDDTEVSPEALAVLLQAARQPGPRGDGCVIVGGVGDAGVPSYGGRVRPSWWRRTAWQLVMPADVVQPIETFDGNLVLIDRLARDRVGNLDPAYEHAMGDYDWGLRARAAGVGLWLAPGVLGRCADNARSGGFTDPAVPLRVRWRHLLSPKGLPWRSWLRFTWRHAGWAWPIYFVWPYLRVTLGLRPRQ
jgi:GT2 family glycosyltransferase